MRIAAVMVLAAAIALPTASLSAKAASTEVVFRAFGLFGNWAPDCDRPATPANPHVSIVAAGDGEVQEVHDLGPDYVVNRYKVLSAERLSAERLQVKAIFQPGTDAEERQMLVFLVRGPTRRTMVNRKDGGEIRVRHGIALANGGKTAVLRKCG